MLLLMLAGSLPARVSKSVVLPQPLGPMIANMRQGYKQDEVEEGRGHDQQMQTAHWIAGPHAADIKLACHGPEPEPSSTSVALYT